MKKYMIALLSLILSCNTKSEQDLLFVDCTVNDGWQISNQSILIDSLGGVFVKRGDRILEGRVSEKHLKTLDSLSKVLVSKVLDSIYSGNVQDYFSFKLLFSRKGKEYHYSGLGGNYPPILEAFILNIVNNIDSPQLRNSSKQIQFKSTFNSHSPNIDSFNRKFVPPVEK